jgi:hypothetical protein
MEVNNQDVKGHRRLVITDENLGTIKIEDSGDAKALVRSLIHFLQDRGIETQVTQGHVTFTNGR